MKLQRHATCCRMRAKREAAQSHSTRSKTGYKLRHALLGINRGPLDETSGSCTHRAGRLSGPTSWRCKSLARPVYAMQAKEAFATRFIMRAPSESSAATSTYLSYETSRSYSIDWFSTNRPSTITHQPVMPARRCEPLRPAEMFSASQLSPFSAAFYIL